MKRIDFKCTLLTDIIISAKTATEGEHQSLDFIPGSNFLGILAGLVYSSNSEENYTIFHSGKVRFGDAHIASNGKRSFQIPFSWYFPKGGELTDGENYLLNFMKHKHFDDLITKGKQLDQARNGYFTLDSEELGFYIPISKMFSQKSANDSTKRRSAESEMFGYEAIQEGSEFHFSVDVDDTVSPQIIDQIYKLTGEKRLGRSRTAEFGQIKIESCGGKPSDLKSVDIGSLEIELEYRNNNSYTTEKENLVLLYAESRLAFRDKNGQPTFTPRPEDLGLPTDATILWDRSQIRTGSYAPMNKKRSCYDEDRVFIEKGSVFVVKVNGKFSNEIILYGVGYYRTDGFGQLLVNPDFLKFDFDTGKLKLQLKEIDKKSGNPRSEIKSEISEEDKKLLLWLKQQTDSFKKTMDLVDDFVKNYEQLYDDVTNSQWGKVRENANSSANKRDLMIKLFEPGERAGSLTHGISLQHWQPQGIKQLNDTIESISEELALDFTEHLASLMQKKGEVV